MHNDGVLTNITKVDKAVANITSVDGVLANITKVEDKRRIAELQEMIALIENGLKSGMYKGIEEEVKLSIQPMKEELESLLK